MICYHNLCSISVSVIRINNVQNINECKKCKRKFVNLKRHYASGNCFQNETSQSIPEGNANNINKDKSCPPPKGSNNSFKSSEFSEKSNSGKESTSSSEPQNIACKGCAKVYKRLMVHLKSKNGQLCKSLYSPEELDKPNKWKAYYEKNKKKILEKQKEYQKQTAEKNSEKIKIAKKKHYDENDEKIKNTFVGHPLIENKDTNKTDINNLISKDKVTSTALKDADLPNSQEALDYLKVVVSPPSKK